MSRHLQPSRLFLAVLILSTGSVYCEPDAGAPQAPEAALPQPNIIEKSGVTVIPLGLKWDIDHDIVGTPARRDLAWEHGLWEHGLSVQPEVSFPEPTDARVVLVRDKAFESIGYASLASLKIDQTKIPKRKLQPGAAIALRTSEGALAKLRVKQYYRGGDFSFKGAENIMPSRKENILKDCKDDEFFNIELEWTLYQEAGKENAGLQEALMSQLRSAIMQCKPWVIRELLGAHPELVNTRDEFGNPPLHEAANWGNAETLRVVIAAGADVNATLESSRITALEEAAGTGVVSKVQVLIEGGADVNARDRDGVTPLTAGIGSGNPRMVEMLLKRGAKLTGNEMASLHNLMESEHFRNRDTMNEPATWRGGDLDPIRRTWIKAEDFEEITKLLFAQGVDISKPAGEDATQLHEAARFGQVGVARQLIVAGLKVNAKDPRGRTPLHEAVSANQLEMVEFLLSQGADVNAQDNAGQTPLHETAHCQYEELLKTVRGDTRVAEMLLAKGADIDRADVQGWTPLHHARYYGNGNVAQLLLDKGANTQCATRDGFTPDTIGSVREFFAAAAGGDGSKMAKLIEANPKLLNSRCVVGGTPLRDVVFSEAHYKSETGGLMLSVWRQDPFRGAGWTALHEEVLDGREEIVKLLLAKGADVNAGTSEEGWTPLHVTCWTNSEPMLKILLDAGADINKPGSSGNAPLHEAVTHSRASFVEILLEHGADPNATNRDNLTPLKLDQKRQEELRQMQEKIQPYIAEQVMKQLPEEQRADIERRGGAKALTFGPPLNETEEILRKHGAK